MIAMLAAFVTRKVAVIGGIVLAALVALGLIFHAGEKRGEEQVVKKIEANNAKVEKRVVKRTDTVDACYKSGGVWDRSTGRCGKRPAGVPGVQGQPGGRTGHELY